MGKDSSVWRLKVPIVDRESVQNTGIVPMNPGKLVCAPYGGWTKSVNVRAVSTIASTLKRLTCTDSLSRLWPCIYHHNLFAGAEVGCCGNRRSIG